MSAEIYAKNPDNDALVDTVATEVARILVATGVEASYAHTSGEKAAQYAAELLLSALEFNGEIGRGQVSDDNFIKTVRNIAAVTIDPSKEEEVFNG